MSGHDDHAEPYLGPWWRFPPMQRALVGGLLLGLTFGWERYGGLAAVPATVLYAVSVVTSSSHWGVEAFESVVSRRRVSIDVLMGVATVGSAILGLWEEAAFLAFLYGAAEGLEQWTYDRTRGSVRSLLDLAPKQARLLREGTEIVVPATELGPGDMFVVLPGESFPTDGSIHHGRTSLNEAAVTGESIPVDKMAGSPVFAGTVNLTGRVEVKASTAYEDNTLARIIHLVEEAQEEKTRAQQLIDRFGDRYSPIVLAASILLAVVPTIFGGDFSEWFRRGVTLAVAGAPCALVMSTPVAVAAAIGAAGKRGVLIKGGVHLENLGRVKVVCFDKTGTLTTGVPVVTDVVPANGFQPEDVLSLAAAAEAASEHPLGKAIVAHAVATSLEVGKVEDFEALIGSGVRGRLDGRTILIGKPAMVSAEQIHLGPLNEEVTRLEHQGKTLVALAVDARTAGVIALADEVRPQAQTAIATLHSRNISQVVMLTGDNPVSSRAVGELLDMDQVLAGLSPEDKITNVRRLQNEVGPVAMVGDGINDAPALAAATVGIAMGAAGTDAAVEAADVALLGDDLALIPSVVSLGRRVRTISIQNIAFSIVLLTVLVPAAVLGATTVAVAVTVHEVAEILAVANGLRARRFERAAVA